MATKPNLPEIYIGGNKPDKLKPSGGLAGIAKAPTVQAKKPSVRPPTVQQDQSTIRGLRNTQDPLKGQNII